MVIDARLDRIVRDIMLGLSIGNLAYYLLLSGALWWVFCIGLERFLRHRRISPRGPAPGQIRREVWQSVVSISIWAAINMVVIYASSRGWTRFYSAIDEYGWGWFVFSIVLMIVAHDAYFYWTHRLMHHPRLYRLVHRDHHLSTSPTVWGSYAFGPWEAIVQAGICPLVVLTIPVHPAAYAIFMAIQIGITVFGHCGHEIFPRWFLPILETPLLNSITHHTLHHEKFRSCYSLYFNMWDWLMGTNHPDYVRRFKQVTEPAPAPSAPATVRLEDSRVESTEVPVRKAG